MSDCILDGHACTSSPCTLYAYCASRRAQATFHVRVGQVGRSTHRCQLTLPLFPLWLILDADGTGAEADRRKDAGVSALTIDEFDRASNHPYECRCELCQRWWAEVGPEDDDVLDGQYCECDNEPDEEELASLCCKACGKEITP